MTKILILAPYPQNEAPSQRFRFEHFLKFMEEKGYTYDFQSFLSINAWNNLYKQGKALQKVAGVISGFLRRITRLLSVSKYDYILIHREATPLGPPFIEWIIAKVLKKKIIYDYDDAIWMADQGGENKIWSTLKWRSKVSSICKWSYKVTTGNEFLARFARQYCPNVVILPTIVDTDKHTISELLPKNDLITIGWTGSHSTLFYLVSLIPILQELEKSFEFQFLVIANKDPELPLKNLQFIKWTKETEIEDLAKMDIGVMPLEDNEWSQGKCGFKLIQYLSMGIPAVASPVGVNEDIIKNGETGFLANNQEEWLASLKKLLFSPTLRKKMGEAGRELIISEYSVESQREIFFSLFAD